MPPYKREFHAVLSMLAHARALGTLQFILEEAQLMEAQLNADVTRRQGQPLILWADECDLLVEMMTDPRVGRALLDPSGIILRCNDVLASWVQAVPQMLMGHCMWDVSKSGNADERRAILEKALATGRVQRIRDWNSEQRITDTLIVPIYGAAPCCKVLVRPLHQRRFEEIPTSSDRRIIE